MRKLPCLNPNQTAQLSAWNPVLPEYCVERKFEATQGGFNGNSKIVIRNSYGFMSVKKDKRNHELKLSIFHSPPWFVEM